MNKVRLGEICKPKQWKTLTGKELISDGKYPVYGANGIIGYYNEYNHEKETLLIGCRGTCGALNICVNKSYVNGNAMALDNLREDIDVKYLYYALTGRGLKDIISGAVQPQIIRSDLEKIEVLIGTKAEQKAIIERFDALESVISLRRKELEKLDELIKARFVEMFGDARENPKGFSTVPFIDVVEYMGDIGSNGANKVVVEHLDMKDEEDYAMMVRFTNFTKNDFVEDVKYVSKEAYDFFKKSQIFGGELIICKIGSAGQNYVMPYLNRPVSLGLNQIMVRIKDNILMSYLYQYLHTEYGEFLIAGCINGAVTKTITKTELKKIPVMMPPMELQKQFADFVKQVDKSKVAVQKALDEAQILFDSLMQEYFG